MSTVFWGLFRSAEYVRRRAAICAKSGEGKQLPTLAYGLILLYLLTRALWRYGTLASVGWVYLKYFCARSLQYRRDIIGFAQYMNRCVTHWHFYRFTREMTSPLSPGEGMEGSGGAERENGTRSALFPIPPQ